MLKMDQSFLLKKYRLTQAEYEKAKSLIQRELNPIDWALFSALWSEHCSYKNSIKWLKTLPREGKKDAGKSRGRKCRADGYR